MAHQILGKIALSDNADVALALARLESTRENAGIFFDFDGVLANIEPDPKTVQPLDGTLELLRALVRKYRRVAILSSRPANFLLNRFGDVHGLKIHGLYGLETVDVSGSTSVDPEAESWRQVMTEVLLTANADFVGSDVLVEEKGLSVSLHCRSNPDSFDNAKSWAEDARSRWGPKVQLGRMVVELKPDVNFDKGTTLSREARNLASVWYFGDDLGDLPAMRYLTERRARQRSFDGLAVGVGNDTAVEDVLEASDIFVESPRVLQELIVRAAT